MSETITIRCPDCGTVNRVPPEQLNRVPKCGRCRAALLAGRPPTLTGAGNRLHPRDDRRVFGLTGWRSKRRAPPSGGRRDLAATSALPAGGDEAAADPPAGGGYGFAAADAAPH